MQAEKHLMDCGTGVRWWHRCGGLPAAALVALCCVMPLAWLLGSVLLHPQVLLGDGAALSWFRLSLLGRTLFYNVSAGVLATLIGLPVALVLGRGSIGWRRAFWLVAPASLLMPSLAYAYGWAQFVRLSRPMWDAMGVEFSPAGVADVLRCIWTLAAWLWPVPAAVIGLSLYRMDVLVQQHSVMEGVLWRTTLRQLLGPIVASMAMVTLLSVQEFAVYEPTGISVVATEIRMVFETGAFSGAGNPMTGPVAGGALDQTARSAAAVATAGPLLVVMLALAGLAAWLCANTSGGDEVTTGNWPRVLRTPWWIIVVAAAVVVMTIGVPVASLLLALRVPFSPSLVWTVFGHEVSGSLTLAAIAAAVAMVIGLSASVRWTRGMLVIAGLCFLAGGQLVAIAAIRLWDRPLLLWAYDAFPVPVMTYISRFGWIALVAARGTWGTRWRDLRAMAALDGAGEIRTAVAVVWPLVWPTLAAGALLVAALSMTEVPATILLRPQRPEVLTPMLMSWVHITRYDPMIEASLMMMGMVLTAWLMVLAVAAVRWRKRWE